MITPLDIQNKEFSKGVRGYKEEDVDSFLDLITVDMEKLIDENRSLKDAVKSLNAELTRYKSTENTVLETLEAAKALMGDISASAEKRAEILLKNAELDAELITREARESVDRLSEEYVTLRNRLAEFRSRYKNLLESELDKFDVLSAELFSDMAMTSFEDLKGIGDVRATADFRLAPSDASKDAADGKTVMVKKEFVANAARSDLKADAKIDYKTQVNLRLEDKE